VDRTPVGSSNIASIGYDPDSQTLEVEFVKGGIYQYFQVPSTVYEEFMAASSKGSFHSNSIKNRYPYSRVG